MIRFNVVFRIWRDLPMLIWDCGRFLDSLCAGRPLARCRSSIGNTYPHSPTRSQIVNFKVDAGCAHFPGSAYLFLARLSFGAETATVEGEIGGRPNRRFLNTDSSF